jgi:acyl-CoA synthetase (AMP-forming)/AMP-acid ligase II
VSISTIEGIVRAHGVERPNAPMATFDGRTMTYGEMDARSNRVANALLAEGLSANSRIAIVAKNCHAMFETLFAVRKIGGVQVAVNWRLAPDEMRYIINDAEAAVIFVGAPFVQAISSVLDRMPSVRKVVVIDGPAQSFQFYEQWLGKWPATDPGYASNPDDVVLQLYTSGTTGRPKGVLLMNRSLFAFVHAAQKLFLGSPAAVHMQALPLFHVGGINWSLQAFSQGSHCIAFQDFEADAVIAEIERSRATHLMTVPMVIQLLLSRPSARKADFSSLRVICYGGSIIAEKILRDAIATFGCSMFGMYGSTELSFGATILTPEEHLDQTRPELLRSCGRPLPGSTIKVIDPSTSLELEDGKPGEIWFKSPQRGLGYWRQPEATADKFRSDGWYRTGDVGHVENGYIYISDRLDDMIISGAENIYPAEVERVLLELPQVAEAVVFGIPDLKWGESVHATIVRSSGSAVDASTLIALTRDHLAHYKCPRSIDFVETLPRNPSGKVLRTVLRAPFWAGQTRRIG